MRLVPALIERPRQGIVGALVVLAIASVGIVFLPSALGLIAVAQAAELSSRPPHNVR